MSLVVREMQSNAAQIQQRLRNPPNAVQDRGIDLKRKVIPILNEQPAQEVTVTTLDVFGPKLPSGDDIAFGPVVLLLAAGPKRHSIEEIQRAVCAKYQLTRLELISDRRTSQIVRPRQIAMYLCKLLTPRSLPEIGSRFGDKDHTTVMHANRKIGQLRRDDPIINADVVELLKSITA